MDVGWKAQREKLVVECDELHDVKCGREHGPSTTEVAWRSHEALFRPGCVALDPPALTQQHGQRVALKETDHKLRLALTDRHRGGAARWVGRWCWCLVRRLHSWRSGTMQWRHKQVR